MARDFAQLRDNHALQGGCGRRESFYFETRQGQSFGNLGDVHGRIEPFTQPPLTEFH